MTRTRRWPEVAVGGLLGVAVLAIVAGCQPYRVEYHRRPSFYRQAGAQNMPDRVTLDDGTVIVFSEREFTSSLKPDGKPLFKIREEQDDGTVVLRASVPEDVLANTLNCLRNEEYELLWEQMVAQRTKDAYEAQRQGAQEFSDFLKRNRRELAATLTRMLLGLSRQEAFMENAGGGVIRCQFYPHVAKEFRFKTVEIVAEPGGLRLLVIK